MISLVKNTIENCEIDQLRDWLGTYPRLTQGEQVKLFEQKWSIFLGSPFSTFVNSGSSALLLAYYALKIKGAGQNVVVPALSWATDVAPLIQLGFNPILCDCNLDDLSLDLNHLEKLLSENTVSIVNIVSVLGLVPNMDKILELKEKYEFYLIEDVCESFGSKWKNRNLGTFGDISVFSLFFGHHLSTIEGGMICANDDELNDIIKMIRAHGWDRELSDEKRDKIRKKYNIDDFSASYTFYYPGFNVRSTDLQAFLGILQLDKADDIINKRHENYHYIHRSLDLPWKPQLHPEKFVSNFCFPVIDQNKCAIVERLKNNNIETRPLICGSMGQQPFFKDIYGEQHFPHCDYVDKYGLYVPNNPELTLSEIDLIIESLNGQ